MVVVRRNRTSREIGISLVGARHIAPRPMAGAPHVKAECAISAQPRSDGPKLMGSEAQAVAAISLLHAEVRAVGVAILEETAAARCRAVERQAGGVAGVLPEEQLIGIAVGFDGGEVGLRRTEADGHSPHHRKRKHQKLRHTERRRENHRRTDRHFAPFLLVKRTQTGHARAECAGRKENRRLKKQANTRARLPASPSSSLTDRKPSGESTAIRRTALLFPHQLPTARTSRFAFCRRRHPPRPHLPNFE